MTGNLLRNGVPPPEAGLTAPAIVDPSAHEAFRRAARSFRLDPDSAWVDHYAEYEWSRLRHALDIYIGPVAGLRVLEFGCNVGGSAVVLAALGAEVTGVDVDSRFVQLARLNLERHGLNGRIEHAAEPPGLPFPDAAFDLVTCNSVLEYVNPQHLPQTLSELRRVLRPGGILLIIGTSNRLWPREVHSSRWLVNYLPRRVFWPQHQRGVFPWQLTAGWIPIDRSPRKFTALKRRIGGSLVGAVALVAASTLLRMRPGLLNRNILAVLKKPG